MKILLLRKLYSVKFDTILINKNYSKRKFCYMKTLLNINPVHLKTYQIKIIWKIPFNENSILQIKVFQIFITCKIYEK